MVSETFEQRIERACNDREIPGAVVSGGDNKGNFLYEKTFGYRSLKDPENPDPMPLDATMWLASCTKLMGTIAALQCVERGLLQLDDDISSILPELRELQILKGFEKGPDGMDKPILVDNMKVITLRHLLTHSSGLGYDFFNPILKRYRATEGFTPSLHVVRPMMESFTFPLLFAPGEGWEYGVGIDWANWAVERVTGLTIEQYMEENIWGPLGIKSMTFHPKTKPACMEKLTDMSVRSGGKHPIFSFPADSSGKVEYIDNLIWNLESPGISAGVGCYGSVVEFQKILHSICANDEKLLAQATVEAMFKPQLSEASRKAWLAKLAIPEIRQAYGGLPQSDRGDWGLGGCLIMEDVPDTMRKGTMVWGGYPNLQWFCDRSAGISGIFGSQIFLPGDLKEITLYKEWQKELYTKMSKEKL